MRPFRSLASLRYRFTLVMLAASLSFGIVVTAIAWLEGERALEAHTRQAALATLEAFARPAADRLLTEDDLRLRELIVGILSNNDRWLRVTVTDGSGQVRVKLPEDSDLSGVDLDETHEVSAALLDPSVGTMSALISNQEDHRQAAALVLRLGGVMALLTGAGLAIAGLLGVWLTRDLEGLAGLVERIGEGELGVTLPDPGGKNEVAVLARALNQASRKLGDAQEALAVQQAHLVETEKLAAIGSLASGLAHEVANPVGGAMNCLQRLGRPDLTEEKRETYRQLALDATERAATVLKGLLHLARGASFPGHGMREETTVASVLEQPARMASVGSQVSVQLVSPEPLPVTWPRAPVEQILTNLLLNATRAATSRVAVSWRREGDAVLIEVVDDGPGPPPERADRCFEPFFSTRPPGQGTGLGLPVARSIARSLGGDVGLRPGSDQGAVAWVRLPATIEEASDAA